MSYEVRGVFSGSPMMSWLRGEGQEGKEMGERERRQGRLGEGREKGVGGCGKSRVKLMRGISG